MIPQPYIEDWRAQAPWRANEQVEQDLVISRAIVLKALYSRKKGRDLFDLYWALTHLNVDVEQLRYCCNIHYQHVGLKPPTIKQFLRNMEEKLTDPDFTNDIFTVLKPNVEYDNLTAWELVKKELVEVL